MSADEIKIVDIRITEIDIGDYIREFGGRQTALAYKFYYDVTYVCGDRRNFIQSVSQYYSPDISDADVIAKFLYDSALDAAKHSEDRRITKQVITDAKANITNELRKLCEE